MCEVDASRNQLRQYTQAKYTGQQIAWTYGYECVCFHLVRWARTPRAFNVALAQGCISMAESAQVANPERSENDFAKRTARIGVRTLRSISYFTLSTPAHRNRNISTPTRAESKGTRIARHPRTTTRTLYFVQHVSTTRLMSCYLSWLRTG